jgi:hypothetical protein
METIMRPTLLRTALMLVFVSGTALSAVAPRPTTPRISKVQAIEVAKHTAQAKGIALSQYQLDNSSSVADHDKQGWLIAFHCLPQPAPPGCGFFVRVDWNTGKALLLMGQ